MRSVNRRTIPFGYKFENGAVVVEDSAADIVKEIFNRYLAGDSMLNISVARSTPLPMTLRSAV